MVSSVGVHRVDRRVVGEAALEGDSGSIWRPRGPGGVAVGEASDLACAGPIWLDREQLRVCPHLRLVDEPPVLTSERARGREGRAGDREADGDRAGGDE